VVRGLAGFVLAPDEHGPGAAALVRDESGDLFGYGTREAVVRAVAPSGDRRGFGAPAGPAELGAALEEALGPTAEVRTVDALAVTVRTSAGDARAAGRAEGGAVAVARAHGWLLDEDRDSAGTAEVLRFRPRTP
jgi:coenzyme F420-0:L-glutamate ligase/coenzyme F420-1:gamma-L-glutamate ligase